jgi:hypothetical protein
MTGTYNILVKKTLAKLDEKKNTRTDHKEITSQNVGLIHLAQYRENLPQRQFVHHKSLLTRPGREPWPPWWQVRD